VSVFLVYIKKVLKATYSNKMEKDFTCSTRQYTCIKSMAHARKNSKTGQMDFFETVYHNEEERKNTNYSL
jgi:hypothetical protein